MLPLLKKVSSGLAGICALALSTFAQAEDIDMFIGGSTASGGLPNVLVVLDNTANWSRDNQAWPAPDKQGQSEIKAILNVLDDLDGKVNLGLMAYTTDSGNHDGGYVRFGLKPLDSTNRPVLEGELDVLLEDYNKTTEQHSANTPYGNLIGDVYNYLAGKVQSNDGTGTRPDKADGVAYGNLVADAAKDYSRFESPLTAASSCVKTYVIFISNPNSNGPSSDKDNGSSQALIAAYNEAKVYFGLDIGPDKLANGQGAASPLPISKSTTTTVSQKTVQLGFTENQCYVSAAACVTEQSAVGGLCAGVDSCSCANPQQSSCPEGQNEYLVEGVFSETTVDGTGLADTTIGAGWNLDDWTKFLNRYGVPIPYQDESGATKTLYMPVVTYTIDVYNKAQNAEHTGLMLSAAEVGGGKYFAAKSQAEITRAIKRAISEILSANTTFAAVALPLSATNRAQNENQVFIGMFRPDQQGLPRWYGNLKRYQIALIDGHAELADVNSDPAVNPLTDFPTECATSFWSFDSGNYWEVLHDADRLTAPYPRGNCLDTENSPWSDAPDGPFVEKGGAAQMLRSYPDVDAPDIAARNVKTVGGTDPTGLITFDSSFSDSVTGGAEVIKFIRGEESVDGGVVARHDIHGDVVHSRPLPINFAGTTGIRVFYGTNDGLLRAIDAATGMERWSFVAPEHFDKLNRLKLNAPRLPGASEEYPIAPKGYFFDGAIGSHLEYGENNVVTKAYIYPTMRRGGRMVYAFDVTTPDNPKLLWRRGCGDAGCTWVMDGKTDDFSDIGQTWSMPKSARLRGINLDTSVSPPVEKPVVIFGGGYDNCEDDDKTASLASVCTSNAKGRVVYVLDAATGKQVMKFTHADMGSIIADISLVSMNYDGITDYAYAVDLSGNVWRMSFTEALAGAAAENRLVKIAHTSDSANPRKFFNAPSVFPYQGKVYLAFGSGNRERPLQKNYPYREDIEDRYYVFLDNPNDGTDYDLDDEGSMHDYTTPSTCEDAGVYGETAMRGWFMGMPGQGEQVVTTSVIAGGAVSFNTYRPNTSQAGMCKPGVSTSYRVNLFNASGAVGTSGGAVCGGERSIEIDGGSMPIAPTVGTVEANDPSCTGDDCSEVVTFCIGCEGLSPVEIEPNIDQVRERNYWNSDIDR